MALAKKSTKQPLTTAQQLGSLIKSARDIMRKDKGLNGDLDRLPMLTWVMFLKFFDDLEIIHEQKAGLAGKPYRPIIQSPYRWRDWAAKEDGISGPDLIHFINDQECVRQDGTKGKGLFEYLRQLRGTDGGKDQRDVIANIFRGVNNRMGNGFLLREIVNKVNRIHFSSSEEIHTLSHLYESMLKEMRDAAGDSGEFYTPRAVVKFMVEVTNPRLGEIVLDPACGTGGFLVEAFTHLSKQTKTVQDRRVLQEQSIFGGEAKSLPYLLAEMNLLLHGVELPQIDPRNSLITPLTDIGDRDRVDVILTNPPFGGEEEAGIQGNFPDDKQTGETALLFLQLIMRKLRRSPKPGRAGVVVPESTIGDPGVTQRIRQELVEKYNLHTIVRLPKGVFEPYSDIQTNLLFFDTNGSTTGVWFYQHEVPEERQAMKNPCYTKTKPLTFLELKPLVDWWAHKQETDSAWYVPVEDIRSKRFSLDFRNPKRATTGVGAATLVSELESLVSSATGTINSLRSGLAILQSRKQQGKRYRFGEFLSVVKVEANVKDDETYKQVTVKLYGKGVVERCTNTGRELRTRPQFTAFGQHLIMSRIDARNGAFGIVPQSLDGALITNDFPLFSVDADVIEPEFLALLLTSSAFLDACKRASRGTTNRKRLKEELFLAEQLVVPEMEFQRAAVSAARLAARIEKDVTAASLITDSLASAIADALVSENPDQEAIELLSPSEN